MEKVQAAQEAIVGLLEDGEWHDRVDIIEGLETAILAHADIADALNVLRGAGAIEMKRPKPARRKYFRLAR